MAAPSAPPGPPSGSSTSPFVPPAAPAPPPRSGLSGGAKAGIAVVVVVVLVVAVLALGLIPGVSLFGKGGNNEVSSSDALGHASGVAASHDAGSLILAAGVSTTFSFSFGYVPGNVSCPVSGGFTGDSENFTVPAESGGYASGSAALWVFLYYNATTPSESVLAVVGSTTYFLGQVSGALCVGSFTSSAIPADAVSSATAASAVGGAASTFTSAHGSATAIYALIENGTAGPVWYIAFTNCSYDPDTNTTTGGTDGDLFAAVVNGTSGQAVDTEYLTTLNCTSFSDSNLSLDSGVSLGWIAGSPGAPAESLLAFATTAQSAVVSVGSTGDRAGNR